LKTCSTGEWCSKQVANLLYGVNVNSI